MCPGSTQLAKVAWKRTEAEEEEDAEEGEGAVK